MDLITLIVMAGSTAEILHFDDEALLLNIHYGPAWPFSSSTSKAAEELLHEGLHEHFPVQPTSADSQYCTLVRMVLSC